MSGRVIFISSLYGVMGWFAAAMMLRFLAPVTFGIAGLHLLMLLFAAALAYPTILMGAWLTGLPMHRMLGPTAVLTAAAAFCDGLAITYAPEIYGGTGPNLAWSGAAILFGISWIMIVAVWLDSRTQRLPGD
jgi:hypothetical protein